MPARRSGTFRLPARSPALRDEGRARRRVGVSVRKPHFFDGDEAVMKHSADIEELVLHLLAASSGTTLSENRKVSLIIS